MTLSTSSRPPSAGRRPPCRKLVEGYRRVMKWRRSLSKSEDNQLEDTWELAKSVYELQYPELQRVTAIAGSLLTAVTLSAALAAPLLVLGIRRSLLDALFGIGLLAYLLCLGNAIRYALRILYSPLAKEPVVHGVFNLRHVATFADAEEYEAYFKALSK